MDYSRCRAVIVVFAMRGCPACEDYKPRLERQVRGFQQAPYHVPLVFGAKGQAFAPHQIPILILDAESPDPQIQALADEHKITGVPATILFARYAQPLKLEGALDDHQIYDLLCQATHA